MRPFGLRGNASSVVALMSWGYLGLKDRRGGQIRIPVALSKRFFGQCWSARLTGQSLPRAATNQLNLSAPTYHRVLKLARTIAGLAGSEAMRYEADGRSHQSRVDTNKFIGYNSCVGLSGVQYVLESRTRGSRTRRHIRGTNTKNHAALMV